ncbi:MAG TPA: SRPBCC domain-containing protein [Cyclobacteriaceae bacterium]|nr:SRPBCC domain-containing protein [Cyclobacteriaceae bacterium]
MTINHAIPNGKAVTIRTTFSRETSIRIDIKSTPAVVWALLTNAPDYPRWNPSVIFIEGIIAPGEKIKLKSALDPKRTFKLRVQEFEPQQKLVWGDGQGSRTYTLSDNKKGITTFSMVEKIGGFMFPLYAKYIPPFDASFEQFASGLKKEAEAIINTK